METLPRRSQTTRTTETTSIAWIKFFYPDDRDDRVNFESPGSFAIVWVAFPYDRPGRLNIFFETTGAIGTIRTIIWKPGFSVNKLRAIDSRSRAHGKKDQSSPCLLNCSHVISHVSHALIT